MNALNVLSEKKHDNIHKSLMYMQILFIIVLVFMALISSVSGTNAISYGLLPLFCLFYGKKEYLLCFLLFSVLVFCCIPPAIPLSPFILILYICSVFTSERLQRINNIRIYPGRFALLMICIVCFYFSCYGSIAHSFDKFPVFVLFALLIYYAGIDHGLNLHLLTKLLRIAAIVGTVYVFLKLIFLPEISDEGRRTLSVTQNANSLGRALAVLMLIFFRDLFVLRRKSNLIYIVLCFISIFLTGSRTSLLAAVVSIFSVLYVYSTQKAQMLKYAFVSCFTVIILFVVLNALEIGGISRYLDIFSLEKMLANTRIYTWGILFTEVIPDNWLWGIGLGNINSEIILGYVPDGDNMYVDVLTQLGIIGLIVLLCLLFSRFSQLFRLNKTYAQYRLYLFFPLGLLFQEFFFSFTESVFDEVTFWFTISLSFIYANAIKQYERKRLSLNHCA